VEETVRRIAASALSATDAEAAIVERLDPDLEEVEIVATSGACGPRLHQRFPYGGSVSGRVVETRAPVQWNAPENDGSLRIRPYLQDGCEGGKVLAVPLLDGDRAMGSLILLRTAHARDFGDQEAVGLGTFGDLAALEFRRISLLAESEQRRRELERVTESRARLLRGFSHDVKNALGAADGYAQLLEEGVMGVPSDKQRMGIGHVRRSLAGALKLTEDLLHLARAEAGHIQIDWVSTDVRGLAAAIAEAYRPQAKNKRIEMSLELEEDLPPIRSDPTRIQQVLGNLLSNAAKYTPEGGHVRIVAGRGDGDAPRTGSWLHLSVVDDGPGIPPEQQSAVFDEFVRLSPDQGAGSGLGLAISRRVAWALEGDLTVKSEPGSGCEFTLWLPFHEAVSGDAQGHHARPGPVV
jgi:signal transduction histidine kinase